MNKIFKIFSILTVLAVAFTAVTPAYAQEGTPPTPGDGLLSDYFASAFASAIGLTVEEVQSRVDAGETRKQIAESLGYFDIWTTIGSSAISQAVADGTITQEQADRLANREKKREPGQGGQGGAMLEDLGLTREEMKALLDSGMTLQEIYAQQGVEMQFGDGTHAGNGGAGGKIVEQCGLTYAELKAGKDSGQSIQDMCPDLARPERGEGPND